MPTNANTRTDSVGDSSLAGIVKFRGYLSKKRASTNCGLPCGVVHAEVLEVDHINGDSPVNSAQPCGLQVSPSTGPKLGCHGVKL